MSSKKFNVSKAPTRQIIIAMSWYYNNNNSLKMTTFAYRKNMQ